MAECLFAGFVILMMFSAHRAFSTGGKTRDAFLAGIWVGLAFLTKTLGILFLPFLILGFLFGRGGHSRTGAVKQTAVALLGFLILAVPYWIALRRMVGSWVIDGKGLGQEYRILAGDLGEEHVDPRYSGALTADGSDFLINSKQPVNGQEFPLSKFIGVSARKYVQKLVRIYQDYPFTPTYPNKVLILYLFPAMLLGLGLFMGRGTWRERESDRFLLYWMCPWIFALPLIFIEVRYYIPMAPLALPFIALGAEEVGRWVDRRFRGREKQNPSARAMMVVIAIFVLLAAPKLTYKITHWKDPELSYNPRKVAAEWLLDNGYHPTRIMEYGHSVSFYSGAQSILIPTGSIEDVIRIAGKYNVDLISLDEFYLHQGNRRPELDYLLDSTHPAPPELNRIYVDERYPGLHHYIYRIRTPEEIAAFRRLNVESR
jgi:4-amino-4-deoxy-L-arabinose transferase-like glycosyltransferase